MTKVSAATAGVRTARPLRKVLIANRGEIAARILRACRKRGLQAVALYSEADRGAPYLEMADEAWFLGPAPPSESYLAIDRILAVATASDVDAIHPGYGFLAENADFARRVIEAGMIFVGPRPEVITLMGSKTQGKAAAVEAGLPVVPGYAGEDQDPTLLAREAQRIGYPLMIKARAGGGGRGMRRVDDPGGFAQALALAKGEARAAFGDDHVLLERLIDPARHVEVQILGDHHGQVRHLFDRDCSVQRRHQKLVEEALAPDMPEELRSAMTTDAVRLAAAIGYEGAGTVEFLVHDGAHFFIEMNTRLQVEHGVTEMVTGIDIVDWQLRVAAGEALDFPQETITCDGAAIEVRLLAEDPQADGRPTVGTISAFRAPSGTGVRVDHALCPDLRVPPDYDSLLAKVMAHGESRAEALARLEGALAEAVVTGFTTNQGQLRAILGHPQFRAGAVDTGFFGTFVSEMPVRMPLDDRQRALAALAAHCEAQMQVQACSASPWHSLGAWRVSEPAGRSGESIWRVDDENVQVAGRERSFSIEVAQRYQLDVTHLSCASQQLRFESEGRLFRVTWRNVPGGIVIEEGGTAVEVALCRAIAAGRSAAAATTGEGVLRAPIPGRVVELAVQKGARVSRGDTLVVIEAMKLLQAMTAPCDGVVTDLPRRAGDAVEVGAVLAIVKDEETDHV
jgi:3-methylcrotonyl-CoA carboxylase alpha subunit